MVIGGKAKLAIECDGDRWHGPAEYEQDLARQRDLERCGWRFFRIRESAFYVDAAAALAPLWDLLEDLEIHSSGWDRANPPAPAAPRTDGSPPSARPPGGGFALAGERAGHRDEAETGLASPASPTAMADPPTPASESYEPPQPIEDGAEPVAEDAALAVADGAAPQPQDDEPWSNVNLVSEPVVEQFPTAVSRGDGSDSGLAAYTPFGGTLTPALEARREEQVDGVRAVVAAEGPVLGSRLHQAYVRASGGQRVGRQIGKALNGAVSYAVRRGIILEDAPLGEVGVRPKTFRLPDQPAVVLRELGPRDFDQIPPRELAEVLRQEACKVGRDDVDRLYRAVLARYGLKRLTANVRLRLDSVRPLAT